MSHDEVLKAVIQIIQDVFNDSSLEITPETTADDIDGWDFMRHINIVVAVEANFGVRFHAAELESLRKVGDLASLIEDRLKTVSPVR